MTIPEMKYQDESGFMCRSDLSDMDKLILDFEYNKEGIKQYFPQMYYCLLAVKDKYKQGYRLIK